LATRGDCCELPFRDRAERAAFSAYVKAHLGHVVRVILYIEMDEALFDVSLLNVIKQDLYYPLLISIIFLLGNISFIMRT
jgi:hypothetical protein